MVSDFGCKINTLFPHFQKKHAYIWSNAQMYASIISTKAFKEQCVFEAAYVISSKKKTVDGKEVTYQEKIPISSYAAATAQPDGGDGGDGD